MRRAEIDERQSMARIATIGRPRCTSRAVAPAAPKRYLKRHTQIVIRAKRRARERRGKVDVRDIEIEDGLTIRFPDRDEQFVLGVEIGMLAALMGGGARSILRRISAGNLEQARRLAPKMGYRLEVEDREGEWVYVRLNDRTVRPKLRLVQGGSHS